MSNFRLKLLDEKIKKLNTLNDFLTRTTIGVDLGGFTTCEAYCGDGIQIHIMKAVSMAITPEHNHPNSNCHLYVVSGAIEVLVRGALRKIDEASSIMFSPGEPHAVRPLSIGTTCIMIIVPPDEVLFPLLPDNS